MWTSTLVSARLGWSCPKKLPWKNVKSAWKNPKWAWTHRENRESWKWKFPTNFCVKIWAASRDSTYLCCVHVAHLGLRRAWIWTCWAPWLYPTYPFPFQNLDGTNSNRFVNQRVYPMMSAWQSCGWLAEIPQRILTLITIKRTTYFWMFDLDMFSGHTLNTCFVPVLYLLQLGVPSICPSRSKDGLESGSEPETSMKKPGTKSKPAAVKSKPKTPKAKSTPKAKATQAKGKAKAACKKGGKLKKPKAIAKKAPKPKPV